MPPPPGGDPSGSFVGTDTFSLSGTVAHVSGIHQQHMRIDGVVSEQPAVHNEGSQVGHRHVQHGPPGVYRSTLHMRTPTMGRT